MFRWFSCKKEALQEVLILGDKGTGKFSLFQALRDGIFDDRFENPELTDFSMTLGDNEQTIKFAFYIDSTSSDRKKLPRAPTVVLSIIDLSSERVEEDYYNYKQRATTHYPQSKAIFVGTKQDLSKKSMMLEDLIITSAKTMTGIDKLKQAMSACQEHSALLVKYNGTM